MVTSPPPRHDFPLLAVIFATVVFVTLVLACAVVVAACVCCHHYRKKQAKRLDQRNRVVLQGSSRGFPGSTRRQASTTRVDTRVNTRVNNTTGAQQEESYTVSSNTWERTGPSRPNGNRRIEISNPIPILQEEDDRNANATATVHLNTTPARDETDHRSTRKELVSPTHSQSPTVAVEHPTSRSVEMQENPRLACAPSHSTAPRLSTTGSFANQRQSQLEASSPVVAQETTPKRVQQPLQFNDGLEDLIQDLHKSIQEDYVPPSATNSLPRGIHSRHNTLGARSTEAEENPRFATSRHYSYTAPRPSRNGSSNQFNLAAFAYNLRTSGTPQDDGGSNDGAAVFSHNSSSLSRGENIRTMV